MRRFVIIAIAAFATAANADSTRTRAAKAAPVVHKSSTNKGTTRLCEDGHCKRVAVFSGHNAPKASLRKDPLTKPSGEVWLRAENLGEEFRGNIYKADGSFDDAALAKLDDLFRCIKTGEVRAVRAELYEHMSRMYDHFGKQIQLVSGFRLAGERDSSRHFHASAMDIRVKDVSIKDSYAFAETLDTGGAGALGIGLYPSSQFIHVDFRAPGEPSFRWVDYSGHSPPRKKSPGRTQPARKPVS